MESSQYAHQVILQTDNARANDDGSESDNTGYQRPPFYSITITNPNNRQPLQQSAQGECKYTDIIIHRNFYTQLLSHLFKRFPPNMTQRASRDFFLKKARSAKGNENMTLEQALLEVHNISPEVLTIASIPPFHRLTDDGYVVPTDYRPSDTMPHPSGN